eukprot:TRINITY_DN1193_c1_g1_i13.p1 TRINITY_DN1193_c1_g1~~TRINITY_DN1193_c1_g1_i13.p1  ORF type:complete len:134 (+),score=57.31 TRINITY_DN1193_c1_g1_i13:116-517(+)
MPVKKHELDFTDPHLVATLLSLAVSVPVFLYFLYQMIVNAHDWDTAFDEDGHMYSQKARYNERLEALKKKARLGHGVRKTDTPPGSPGKGKAKAKEEKAGEKEEAKVRNRKKKVDENEIKAAEVGTGGHAKAE